MINIPGRTGKAMGSPKGPAEFEQEFYLNRAEAANFFRDLAGVVETGSLVSVGRDSWVLSVNPMEPLQLEIQFKFQKKELEVQLKLKENP
jgi:amphi-Trp domain-containing protein